MNKFVSLILCAVFLAESVYGEPRATLDCAAELEAPQPEHETELPQDELAKAKSEFLSRMDRLKTEIFSRDLIGRTYTVEESIALVAGYLTREVATQFVGDWWSRLGYHKQLYRNIPFYKNGLKYQPRFFDFSIRRSRTAKILWSSRKVENEQELKQLVEATIDTFAESAFIPIRRHSVYLRSPDLFLKGNVKIMKEKLLLKIFALGEESAKPSPGVIRSMAGGFVDLLRTMLPFQFFIIRELNLNQNHVRAFRAGGHQTLYHYLRFHEGLPLSFRYAFVHWTNFKIAVILAFIATLAPTIIDARHHFVLLSSLETSSPDEYETAKALYEAMQSRPEKVMEEVREKVAKLKPEERRLLEEALETAKMHSN